MKNENENIITLLDENNQEVDFEIVATLKVDDTDYAILIPLNEPGEEAFIFKMIEENGEYLFECVEDDEEFNIVAEAYEELIRETKEEEEEE